MHWEPVRPKVQYMPLGIIDCAWSSFFTDDKEAIERTRLVEVFTRNVMPWAIGLSDGVWTVELEKELDLSRVYRGKSTVIMRATSPFHRYQFAHGMCRLQGVDYPVAALRSG